METERSHADTALRRPNETIAINPKKGKITLATRRLFNLLLYFSQRDGVKDTYSRSISEVMAHLTTSKDSEWLKKCFRQMQETSIEWNKNDGKVEEWGISSLISEARIIRAGGSTVIAWSLPQVIRERLLDPRFYTKLTLEIHSRLTTGASIALYEICSRYATSPGKVTNRAHWEWWQPRLTGNAKRNYSEYKYFSRETLHPAINEVNQISDLEVSLIEHKNGRRIEEIQFKVTRKKVAVIDTTPEIIPVDEAVLASILGFGVSDKEARALCAEHAVDLLRRTVTLTEQRAVAPNIAPLKSKAAFFKKALDGGYAKPQQEIKPPRLSTAASEKSPSELPALPLLPSKEQVAAQQIQKAFTLWETHSAEERLELLQAFRDQSTIEAYRRDIQRRGVACVVSISLRTAFCEWYANRTWGKVADEALLASAAKVTG